MKEETRRSGPGMLRTLLTLLFFGAVVALLLGLVNLVTAGPIADHKAQKTWAAMKTVLPSREYSELLYEGDPLIKTVYRAGDQGWVIEVTPSGFGGIIDMLVGVDPSGAVTGVSIISMSETSGLGANATRESFRSQYVGKTGSVKLRKQGGEIDALTGATVTSTAVTKGVSAALAAAAELMKEGGQ